MTPREYHALRQVWLEGLERQSYMAATIQATLYNAHFDNEGLPYTPEDMMGVGNRATRKREMFRDHMASVVLNQKLLAPTSADELPDWANRKNAFKETVN